MVQNKKGKMPLQTRHDLIVEVETVPMTGHAVVYEVEPVTMSGKVIVHLVRIVHALFR